MDDVHAAPCSRTAVLWGLCHTERSNIRVQHFSVVGLTELTVCSEFNDSVGTQGYIYKKNSVA
jgi:hypothetical protein